MSTLLQTSDGDIDITSGRTTLVTDPIQAGLIKLRNRFKLFLGEWFRDTRIGVPWFTKVLVKNPSIPLLESIFRQVVINTPPFVDSRDLKVTINSKTRQADVSFTAVVDPAVSAGATVTVASLDKPFIVNLPNGA